MLMPLSAYFKGGSAVKPFAGSVPTVVGLRHG
jgi:hypothetical protein